MDKRLLLSQYQDDPEAPAVETVKFGTPVASDTPRWRWCRLITAFISSFFCGPFGWIAIAMSILAYVDHKANHFDRSRKKERVALAFAITAFVVGSMILALYFMIVIPAIQKYNNILQQAMADQGGN